MVSVYRTELMGDHTSFINTVDNGTLLVGTLMVRVSVCSF